MGAEYQFLDLGNLKGKEDNTQKTSSGAYGVSGDGTAVVGESLSSIGLGITRGNEAFLLAGVDRHAGPGFTALCARLRFSARPGMWRTKARWSSAKAITDKGRQAFRWLHASGKMIGLGTLPQHEESIAYGVSGDGQVIVGMSRGPGPGSAFRWTEASGWSRWVTFPAVAEDSTARPSAAMARRLSDMARGSAGVEAFLWTADSGMIRLGDLAGGRTWIRRVRRVAGRFGHRRPILFRARQRGLSVD